MGKRELRIKKKLQKLVENPFSSLKNQTTTMQTQNTKTISPTTTNQSNFTNNRERERERERGRELIEILTSESVLVCSETVQQKLPLQSERERVTGVVGVTDGSGIKPTNPTTPLCIRVDW